MAQGLGAFLAFWQETFGRWWQPQWNARVLANDVDALFAMASRGDGFDYDEVLSTMTIPCLIFIGEKDDGHRCAQKAGEIIPNATFISLPGLDHIDAVFRTDLYLPHIRRFLTGVSTV